jgi:ssDNA-binding Zn-finger/Zn-ribbon topoisomerase 1
MPHRSMRSLMSDDFAVRCTSCEFTWNTPAMAEGLRVLGACPKCRGALEFRDDAAGGRADIETPDADVSSAAPHMVLGIPRI